LLLRPAGKPLREHRDLIDPTPCGPERNTDTRFIASSLPIRFGCSCAKEQTAISGYKAVDETLHRDVAVKTLDPDLANSEVISRFRAEATILARLNHPQIATISELLRRNLPLSS
jgi:hypothetical protein